jgi:hypothetical protein
MFRERVGNVVLKLPTRFLVANSLPRCRRETVVTLQAQGPQANWQGLAAVDMLPWSGEVLHSCSSAQLQDVAETTVMARKQEDPMLPVLHSCTLGTPLGGFIRQRWAEMRCRDGSTPQVLTPQHQSARSARTPEIRGSGRSAGCVPPKAPASSAGPRRPRAANP